MSRESAAGWAPRRDQMKGQKVGKPGEWTTIKGKRRKPRGKPEQLPPEGELEDEAEPDDQDEIGDKPKEDEPQEPVFQSSHPPLLPTPSSFFPQPLQQASEKRSKQKHSVVCRYYLQGFCRDGKHCHFVHALFPQPLKRSQTQPSNVGSPSKILHRRSASDLQPDPSEDEGPAQDPHLQERGTPPSYNSDSLEDKTTTFSSGRSSGSDTGSEGSNGASEHSSHSFAPSTSPRMQVSRSIPIPAPPGLPSHSSPLISSFSPESLGGLSGFSSSTYTHIPSEPSPSKGHSEFDIVSSSRSLSLSNTPKMSPWPGTHSPRSAPPQRGHLNESPLLSVSAPGSFGSPTFFSLPPPKLFSGDARWTTLDKEGVEEGPPPSSKFEELEDDALHADLDLKLVEINPESELLDQHPSAETGLEPETDPRFAKETELESFDTRNSRSHSLQDATPEFSSFPSPPLSTSAPLYPSLLLSSPPPSPPESPRERSVKSKKESGKKSKPLDSAKSKKVCLFFLQGICRYGTACHHRHQHVVSDQCLSCGNSVGITLKEQKQHLQLCTELTLLNKEKKLSATKKCCLCSNYTVKLGRKFGLLISCNHAFCLQCIREYRGSSDRPSVRACPKCKVTSHYVIPCDRYVSETSRKEKVITEYKKRLGQIECKHFNKGKSTCPFGDACFYRHSTGETKHTPLKKSQSHPPSLSSTPLSSPLLNPYSRTQPPKANKFHPLSSYSPILKDRRPLLPLKKDADDGVVEDGETKEVEGLTRRSQDKMNKNSKFIKTTKSSSASSTPIFRPIPIPPGLRKELVTATTTTTTTTKKGSKKIVETNGKQIPKKV